jgi:integrase
MCNDRATKKKPPDASREPRGAERIIENGLRQRVLSDDELATIWNALDDGGDYAPLLRLLMLTGARREEIAGLRWSEIDPEAALVRLPGERTKNGRPHDIPLVPQALAILKARQRQEGRDFVFGTNGRGFVDFSGSRADFDQRSMVPSPNAGLSPHIVEALLGHANGHRAGRKVRYLRAFVGNN